MEVRQSAAVSVCLLLLLTGCELPPGGPTSGPGSDQDRTSEPSQVVGGDSTDEYQTAADRQPDYDAVNRWVKQIDTYDDMRSRLQSQGGGDSANQYAAGSYDQNTSGRSNIGASYRIDFDHPQTAAGDFQDPPEPVFDSTPKLTQSEPAPPPVAAPVLSKVEVRAASTAPQLPLNAEPTAAGVNATATTSSRNITLAELAEQWLAQPAETSFRQQLDQRLILVLAGKYEDSRKPLELATTEQQALARQFVEALIAIREGQGGQPEAEAGRVIEHIEQLEAALVPMSDLRIPCLAIAQAVRGFGRYEEIDPPNFVAGRRNEFVVYAELRNFLSEETDGGQFASEFSMRTTILNRAGDNVWEVFDEQIKDTCRTRRRDCFIPRLIRLPASLSPGDYVVKVTIIDKIGKKVAEKRATFRLVARS